MCQQWIENSGASSFLSAKLVISKIIPIKNGYRLLTYVCTHAGDKRSLRSSKILY